MRQNQTHRSDRLLVKLLGTLGFAAVAALAVLSITFSGSHLGAGTAVAGSGDAPTNTVFTQPAVPAASTGATATETPPDTTLAIASASPAVKAGG